MDVCVLIPAYNEEQGIKETLERMKKVVKKMKNTDFMVVNDGSTDKTSKIVSKYPVKIIKSKHKGFAFVRNLGWKNSCTINDFEGRIPKAAHHAWCSYKKYHNKRG